MDDHALLKQYAESGSEEAFRALVERHIDPVYSAALRETGNPHLAEELTQVTFIVLSHKAKVLSRQVILSGWLFQTMRFAARNARRQEARRRHREETACMNMEHGDETAWEQMSPLLNEALGALSEDDRNLVALRFFEKKSHTELAQALGINETSARKRLSRAVEKLRALLLRRGVALPAVTLATVLSAHAVQAAPPSLAFSVAGAVQGGTLGTAAAASAKGILQTMAWAKLQKLALAGIAALLLAGGAAAVLAPEASKDKTGFVTLADGSQFGIEEHAFSTRFRYRRSGGSLGSSTVGETNLFVATSRKGMPKSSRLSIGRLQLFDEEGATFDGIFTGGTLIFNNEVHNLWRIPAFPRRGKEVGLRFFYTTPAGQWAKAAEFTIPNPAAAEDFARWEPESLPTTKASGELSVALKAFEAGVSVPDKGRGLSAMWRELPATRAVFSFRQAEQTQTPWSVHRIEISDATGNRWKPSILLSEIEPSAEPRFSSTWLGALWAQEPAWKLRVELSRTNQFTAEELLEVPEIPMPKAGELRSFIDAYEVNGSFVNIPLLAAPDVELPEPYKWSRKEGWYNLAVSLEKEGEDKRLTLVKVQDDQGRAVEVDPEGARGGSHLVYGLNPQSNARHLSFTFALHQSRFVEFLAKPVQVGRNPAPVIDED